MPSSIEYSMSACCEFPRNGITLPSLTSTTCFSNRNFLKIEKDRKKNHLTINIYICILKTEKARTGRTNNCWFIVP